MSRQPRIERFNDNVLSKYQIYNGIFMTLPFDEINNTGVLLPLFSEHCNSGFSKKMNPTEIVEDFFYNYLPNASQEQKNSLLFKFIQYIERQVVLFDAIEDAAFDKINHMDGRGTLVQVKEDAKLAGKTEQLKDLLKFFKIRIVLTAHPTQFYPGPVLGIINDLTTAIDNNDVILIKKLLAQLGKTPFFKKQKPTPFDEAVSLIWYLEQVFYHSIARINRYVKQHLFKDEEPENSYIDLGFWPGGDRDGNPFVTADITRRVAERLRSTILKNYYRDVRNLKRRLTFSQIETKLTTIEQKLFSLVFDNKIDPSYTKDTLIADLKEIREILVNKHQSLFLEDLDDLILKVKFFGFHFSALDIRQDSRIHHSVLTEVVEKSITQKLGIFPNNYIELNEAKQIEILGQVKGKIDPNLFEEGMTRSTLESIYVMREIQEKNGEQGANRYIISNCGSVLNMMEVYALLRICGWDEPSVDIIPLFETIDDLKGAEKTMEALYNNTYYGPHLKKRNQKQTIMLGFSDGTKDGGYLMANWGIFNAKESLTMISRKYGVVVSFFDGRGGPPARGGGNTHRFYASLGPNIESQQIQLTIQGQTISSNFGTLNSCQYNLEQLMSSGLSNLLLGGDTDDLSKEDRATLRDLAEKSYKSYSDFKAHEKFIPYLEHMSTLKYYAMTNIGSRPSKRSKSDQLNLSDLRAIPFVGSWSQLKQNVPGFFGVGTSLTAYEEKGEFDKVEQLYKNSSFFRTLIGNSMMSLTKCFFQLTAYMEQDEEFGAFWKIIHDEYLLTKRLILKLADFKTLMEDEPAGKASIEMREQIVLPLLTIQQYALRSIQIAYKKGEQNEQIETFEKMVTRSLFGNINASRNSA